MGSFPKGPKISQGTCWVHREGEEPVWLSKMPRVPAQLLGELPHSRWSPVRFLNLHFCATLYSPFIFVCCDLAKFVSFRRFLFFVFCRFFGIFYIDDHVICLIGMFLSLFHPLRSVWLVFSFLIALAGTFSIMLNQTPFIFGSQATIPKELSRTVYILILPISRKVWSHLAFPGPQAKAR